MSITMYDSALKFSKEKDPLAELSKSYKKEGYRNGGKDMLAQTVKEGGFKQAWTRDGSHSPSPRDNRDCSPREGSKHSGSIILSRMSNPIKRRNNSVQRGMDSNIMPVSDFVKLGSKKYQQ